MRKSLWIMLALLFLAIGPPDAHANDSVVTFDVSGSMSPVFSFESCAPSPCTLGGDIVMNTTTGIVTSVDITLAGASPSVGPFTDFREFVTANSDIAISDGGAGNALILHLSGLPGTLVGYTGGPVGANIICPASTNPYSLTRTPPSRRQR